MIEFYTWGTPNGRKVSILLEELGLEYRVNPIDITAGDQKTPEFVEISPNGRIPAIVDTDTGTRMMESGAIMLYLSKKAGGKLVPTEEKAYWQMAASVPCAVRFIILCASIPARHPMPRRGILTRQSGFTACWMPPFRIVSLSPESTALPTSRSGPGFPGSSGRQLIWNNFRT